MGGTDSEINAIRTADSRWIMAIIDAANSGIATLIDSSDFSRSPGLRTTYVTSCGLVLSPIANTVSTMLAFNVRSDHLPPF